MHPSTYRPRVLLGGGLLLTLLLCCAPAGRGQEAVKGTAVIVPVGGSKQIQMSTKKRISLVENKSGKQNVVDIKTVLDDPTTINLIGQQPDVVTIELTDVDGKKETF